MGVRIRPFRESDRERLREITAEAFDGVSIDQNIERKFGLVGGRDWKFRKGTAIRREVESNMDGVLVAEVNGRVVGYITTSVNPETKIGHIPNLAVHPDFQRRGIGRMLIEAALRLLRERGMEMAKIETLEQNIVASRFYPKMGFVEVARQIHYVKPLRGEG